MSGLPYWRLSAFYFFYFACLGVLVPYWSLYLHWEGFNAKEIGELTAILLLARIIAPNLWSWLADHSNQRMQIVRVTSLFAATSFSIIFFNQSYLAVAITVLLFSFFWNASLPQFEVTTLEHLGDRSHQYSKIRLWGSFGFIAIVMGLGWLLSHFEPVIIPQALFLSALGMWLISLLVPDAKPQHTSISSEKLFVLLKKPAIIAFLLTCFLMQFSHGPYYTFYTIYLEEYGYESQLIGILWALGVGAEIIVFLFMHHWLKQYGIKKMIITSLLLSAVRWTLIAIFPQQLWILISAQLLHAASYGSFHASAIAWVHKYFTGKTRARGQALYSSASFGAGGALGSLMSGYFWLTPGAQWTFIIASIACIVGCLISWLWLKD